MPATGAAAWWAGAALMTIAVSDWASGLWRARILPFGTFIQFPWRLLAQVALWSALAFGVTWARAVERTRRLPAAALAILFFASALPLARVSSFTDAARLTLTGDQLAAIVNGTTGVDEYLPAAAERPAHPRAAIVTADAPTTTATATPRGAGFEITADAAGPDLLTVAQFWFPGWTLDVLEGPAPATLAVGVERHAARRAPERRPLQIRGALRRVERARGGDGGHLVRAARALARAGPRQRPRPPSRRLI